MLKEILEESWVTSGKSIELIPEVLNCGIGGWVSADILINYLLNIFRLKADYVVLYHGITDLHLYLMEEFSEDYLAGRYNAGEVLPQIKRGYWFPKIPWWHSYESLTDRLCGTGNARNEILNFIKKQKPDTGRSFHTLQTQKDLVRHLLVSCADSGTRVIMASYAFYAYAGDEATLKMQEGVQMENRLWRELADEFQLPFVDIDGTIPKTDEYFLDWVHFTPKGMRFVAQAFAEQISLQ